MNADTTQMNADVYHPDDYRIYYPDVSGFNPGKLSVLYPGN
jgi:hypothetical protein